MSQADIRFRLYCEQTKEVLEFAKDLSAMCVPKENDK